MTDKRNGITYAEAGVDIDAGNALVERIKPAARRTVRPGVMAGLGGFGGLFDLKAAGYSDPVLVAATDGASPVNAGWLVRRKAAQTQWSPCASGPGR